MALASKIQRPIIQRVGTLQTGSVCKVCHRWAGLQEHKQVTGRCHQPGTTVDSGGTVPNAGGVTGEGREGQTPGKAAE